MRVTLECTIILTLCSLKYQRHCQYTAIGKAPNESWSSGLGQNVFTEHHSGMKHIAVISGVGEGGGGRGGIAPHFQSSVMSHNTSIM